MRKIGPGQVDGRLREIDAGYFGSAFRKSCKIDSRSAADFQDRPAAPATKIHEPRQVVKLFEVILI